MDVVEAIVKRKSIRGFKSDPVPKEVIAEILAASLRTPSPVNTQPWEITIVTGEVLDELKSANVELARSGLEPSEFGTYGPQVGICRRRQIDLAIQIFQILGIKREERDKRDEWDAVGNAFFGAPVAIFISTDQSVNRNCALFSVGSLSQSIALAALNYGLGTCIQGQGVMYPEMVRRLTGIPDGKDILIAIALGYPDYDLPINELRSPRESMEGVVAWQGFED